MYPQLIALTYALVDDGEAMFVRIVESMWWKKTKTINSHNISVVRLIKVLLKVQLYAMWKSNILVYVLVVSTQNVYKIC